MGVGIIKFSLENYGYYRLEPSQSLKSNIDATILALCERPGEKLPLASQPAPILFHVPFQSRIHPGKMAECCRNHLNYSEI